MENVFSSAGQALAAEDYYDLLTVSADGIMGYVEIPKIAAYLPIYHGTESDVLDVGIGHHQYDALTDAAEHVFLLYGDNTQVQNQEVRRQMMTVPREESMILITTGQKVGEGFDCPYWTRSCLYRRSNSTGG